MGCKFRLCLIFLLAFGIAQKCAADWNDSDDESYENHEFDEERRGHENGMIICQKDSLCKCEKGDNVTINCVGKNLTNANLIVLKEKVGPVIVAHLKQNLIVYLFKNKILPDQEGSLLELDLSQNLIEDIEPGAFDAFTNLLKLKLTHNNLMEQSLSQDIFTGSMANLNSLYLDYNFLGKLDDGLFDNLRGLTKLVLDGNRQLKISNKVLTKALAKLEVLSLDRCNMEELDNDLFNHLGNLRALSLSGNPLQLIPLAISSIKLPNLQALAFSDTYLRELKEGDLQRRVPKLQKLYMRRNRNLAKIGQGALAKLADLEVLDFSDSKMLSHIDKGAFGTRAPAKLKFVNLANCNLSTMAEGTLANVFWGTLDKLQLDGNPWNCDCQLKWLVESDQALRKAGEFGNSPVCKMPESVKDMTMYDARDHIKCGPQAESSTSSMGKFVVLLVFMVMASSLVVFGVVYTRRRYVWANVYGENGGPRFLRIPRFLGGRGPSPNHQMGFSGGRNIFSEGDEDDNDEDMEHEAIGTAATIASAPGQPQPEFV